MSDIHPPSLVSLFLPSLRGGGAERVMLTLGEALTKEGYLVDLVLAQVEGSYLGEISKKIQIVDLKSPRILLSFPALISYLRQKRPKAIISAMNHANLIALLAKRFAKVKTKVVVTVHNCLSLESQDSPTIKTKLIPFLIHYLYPQADAIVAVSKGVADDLADTTNLARQGIEVIYNPVVTPKLLTKAGEPVNHPWFNIGELPVILGVGRLTKQKDFSTLIKAFAIVKQNLSARLVILGEGEERSTLQRLVEELKLEKVVNMPGFVDNPYAYMSKATVLVLSSAWEGFGMVIAEAMACGIPVVSTNCQSGPAEILEEGKYGKLVEVGDVEGLAQAIVNTVKNPVDFNSLLNRALNFSVENSVDRYLYLLNKLDRHD
jgi:glycosyltransferase involved in cell wall biosynthesis